MKSKTSWLPMVLGIVVFPRVERWLTDQFHLPEYAIFISVILAAIIVWAFFTYRSHRLERQLEPHHSKGTGDL